jgi:hypothetical protein
VLYGGDGARALDRFVFAKGKWGCWRRDDRVERPIDRIESSSQVRGESQLVLYWTLTLMYLFMSGD